MADSPPITPIRSGTTLERVIRTSILTAMVVVFCAWCYWDRYVRYPRENVLSLAQNYPEVLRNPPKPDPRITRESASKYHKGTSLNDVTKELGNPHFQGEQQAVYFGEAGALELAVKSGKLNQDAVWKPATPHDAVTLSTQLGMAVVLTPISLILIVQLVRVLTTRAELSNTGLKVRGKPLVPIEAMMDMNSVNYPRKGWVDISYQLDGREGTVRLDDYVYREFPTMIREICARRGYEDPVEALRKSRSPESKP